MCGRYAAAKDQAEVIEEFDVEVDETGRPTRTVLSNPQSPPAGQPDFNMAPTKQALVVLTRPVRGETGPPGGAAGAPGGTAGPETPTTTRATQEDAVPLRQLRLLTWGLVPSWAKDTKTGIRMINARAESVLDKPGFARAAMSRRCLVPADGWYEWQVSPTATDAKGKPRKQPFYTRRIDGQSVAFAGLYEFWRDKSIEDAQDPDAWLVTFTIITTEAEPGLDRIHDRQPLVLEREDWASWLDPSMKDRDTIARLLAFEQPGRFDAYPVATAVNNTRNNGEQLVLPLPRQELHGVVDLVTGEVVGE